MQRCVHYPGVLPTPKVLDLLTKGYRAAVKVLINDDELFSRRRGHICHCANCRKVAGGICETP